MTLLGDAELHERWSAWLLHRNRQGTTTALWISLTLYPLFGVLDYLVAPRRGFGFCSGREAR